MQGISAGNSQNLSSIINAWKQMSRQNAAADVSPMKADLPDASSVSSSGVPGFCGPGASQNGLQDQPFWTTEDFMKTFLSLTNQGLDYGLADIGEGIDVSSSAGTAVNVKRHVAGMEGGEAQATYSATITTASGLHLELELGDDARITDLDDGGISVTYRGSGETHIYDAAGNKTIRQNESGTFTGTDKDDIFINLRGTEVDGGAGNDTIVNFADNAALRGGDGDDNIILGRNVKENSIDTGNGNDSLKGVNIHSSRINMGEGDNTVEFSTLTQGSNMTLGNGNNILNIGNVWDGSSVTIGNGNNAVDMNSVRNNSSLTVGDGENTMNIGSVYENSSMIVGDGNNIFDIVRVGNLSHMNFGHGNNTISMTSTDKNSSVIIGNGNNSIDAGSVTNESNFQIGNGDNTIGTGRVTHGSTLNLGDGDNKVETGNVYMNSAFNIGDGNNKIETGSIETNSSFSLGNGNNNFHVHGVDYNSSASFGSGENTISIGSVTRGSEITIINAGNSTHISRLTASYLNVGTDRHNYSLGQYIRV